MSHGNKCFNCGRSKPVNCDPLCEYCQQQRASRAPTISAPEAGERERDAREIIIKRALWDAGFCGEQSAERGPVMLKVFELVEAARAEALTEHQSLLGEAVQRERNMVIDEAWPIIQQVNKAISRIDDEHPLWNILQGAISEWGRLKSRHAPAAPAKKPT